ncbi:MAG: ABC transporter ATP-binding protein [Candidatus Nanopelagicaceae bacterium]|nr:ABC transporter ATP-binding protein [Candidatus Nanopelagicaceae bacterium]
MSNILELKDVNVTFNVEAGQLHILRDVSLEVPKGSFLCVVGESGCGKSVTAQAIVQLLPDNGKVESGSINFYDQGEKLEINKLEKFGSRMRGLRGAKIGMIFQDTLSSLNPAHRVGRQVAESLLQHMDISKDEAKTKVIELFKKLGIPDPERRYEAYPHEFSGGMRQRVMIAIATVCEPDLVIADEPTTALDVTIQAQIMTLLKDLQKSAGKTFILITHNMALVSEVADHVAVMYLGRVVEYGNVNQVLRNPRHPYTQALLQSVPSLAADKNIELKTVDGQTPSPADVTKGCEFAGRCPFVTDACREQVIPLLSFGEKHQVRCIRLDEKGNLPKLSKAAAND